jgi:phage terminase large subunit
MGVDVASGSEHGDYSAFCVLDCTDKKSPKIVSTLYNKMAPAEFAANVLQEAKKYNALVCVESNSYGLSVIEYLVAEEYVHMYRRVKYDTAKNRYTENLGFNTNKSTRSVLIARMQEYISREWLKPIDFTLQSEINTFVFNKSGKPEAEIGRHDDMIMACALALISIDQVDAEQEIKTKKAPTTIKDMLTFERQTGRLFKNSGHLFEHDSVFDKPLAEAPMSSRPPRY